MPKRINTHKSLHKTLEILTIFYPNNQPISIAEVSNRLEIHKSTASRIFSVLKEYHFVQQDDVSKKFVLGSMISKLGYASVKSLSDNFVNIAKPFVDHLRDIVNDTVCLEVVSGNMSTIAYKADGPHRVGVIPNIGEQMPSHACAGAKAIMAFSSPAIKDKFLPKEFHAFTPKTITSRSIFLEKLKEYKKQGYAVDAEEFSTGGLAIGVPIFNFKKNPVAALVMVTPRSRAKTTFSKSNIAILKKTAAEISKKFHLIESESFVLDDLF
jgi:IclR family transcriptional regulator, KDG regulon repressor